MAKKPKEIRDYYNPNSQKKSLIAFRYNSYKTEQDRINVYFCYNIRKKETVQKNKELELMPLRNQHKFRDRDPKKDLGPEFRFKPRNDIERINDSLYLNGAEKLKLPFVDQKIRARSGVKNRNILSKGHSKSVLGYQRNNISTLESIPENNQTELKITIEENNKSSIHEREKTHFKAATSLFLQDLSILIV